MFAKRLKELMRLKNITWLQVYTDLDINKNLLNIWAKEGKMPSVSILIKIAQYFNVSTDYLLFGDDSVNTHRSNNTLINSINESPNSTLNVGQTFTQQEAELINLYRKASLKTQIQVLNILTGNAE